MNTICGRWMFVHTIITLSMVASDMPHIRISADLTPYCWGPPLSFLKGVSFGRETGVLVLDNLQHSVPILKCHAVLSPHSSQCRWKGSAEKIAAALQEREGRIQDEESQVARKRQVSSPFSLSSWLSATLTCRRMVAVSYPSLSTSDKCVRVHNDKGPSTWHPKKTHEKKVTV